MTRKTTQSLPDKGTARAFAQEDYSLERVRYNILLREYRTFLDILASRRVFSVREGVNPTADLGGGSQTGYPVTYSQLLKKVSFLECSGWPTESGDYAKMASIWEKPREVGEELLAVEPFLTKLYQLNENNLVDDAIDLVIERFEFWLENSAWDACKQALRDADVGRFHPAIALSVLSMTLVEKSRLGTARQDYYLRTERQLVRNYGQDEAEENLRGLK